MPENAKNPTRRRTVLKAIGGTAGIGAISVGAAADSNNRYRGIAYDASSQDLIGNTDASIMGSGDDKIIKNLDFSPRDDVSRGDLKGEIPPEERYLHVPWEKVPDEYNKPNESERKRKREKMKKRQDRKSIDLTNNVVPISKYVSEKKNKGGKYYRAKVGGKFRKGEDHSIVRVNHPDNQIIGNFTAPNRVQKIAFTLVPDDSNTSISDLIGGLN